MKRQRRGTSLIDFIVSIAIIAVLFGGVYLVYFAIVSAVANIGARNAAATALGETSEMIRNLPYDSVGTIGGIPSGVIPQIQTVTVGKYVFSITATIRNIDDPFDGVLGGTPNDTAPADYKLVALSAACPACVNFVPLTVTTTVAPKSLESATQNGSLFITMLNANGGGVSGASIHVVNASVTPSIDLTDTTNASGVLELVGVPTSTQGYQIIASKAGYSSDQTYPPGAAGNPNPVVPNATVAAQNVTSLTLSIDKTSALTVLTSDDRCNAIGGEHFSIQGGKLIGTNPDVLKFSTSSVTNASGTASFPALEWDTYAIALADAAKDVEGTTLVSPFIVNPSSTLTFRFVLTPAADPSLLVNAVDSVTGAGVPDAAVTLSKAGFSATQITNRATFSQTDWSGVQYSAKDPDIDTDTVPGRITLAANASGTYSTSSVFSLTSNTFDVGGVHSNFFGFSWNPGTQAAGTNLAFQVAANNDNATWNYVGPDGSSATSFASSPAFIPVALAGNRYFRYKVLMSTSDETQTPILNDVTFTFTADCVSPYQTLFTNLGTGTYTADVLAGNYNEATTSISVGTGFQSASVPMVHL